MKKKIYFLIIILILIIIFLVFYKCKYSILEDITILSLWNDQYVINPQNQNEIQIDVFKTVYNGFKQHKKIAPGSYGNFKIKLIKSEKSEYQIILKELTAKPQNLIFILDGEKYNSIENMQETINEKIATVDTVKIDWRWEYDINQEKDFQDTQDGIKAKSYIFEVKAIVQ